MPVVLKVPDNCVNLDMDRVARVLAKHRGYFPTAARELGISPVDLKRLTWAKAHLLDEAHEEMEVVVALAWSEQIKAVYSDDPRRRERAADKILSSYAATRSQASPGEGLKTRLGPSSRHALITEARPVIALCRVSRSSLAASAPFSS